MLDEIAGPLFFGAAQKAMSALETVESGVKVVILDMLAVPAIDATGLVALESAIARLNDDGVKVILAGVGGQTLRAFARAVERAREHVAGIADGTGPRRLAEHGDKEKKT